MFADMRGDEVRPDVEQFHRFVTHLSLTARRAFKNRRDAVLPVGVYSFLKRKTQAIEETWPRVERVHLRRQGTSAQAEVAILSLRRIPKKPASGTDSLQQLSLRVTRCALCRGSLGEVRYATNIAVEPKF
jgi:hypothetical protein